MAEPAGEERVSGARRVRGPWTALLVAAMLAVGGLAAVGCGGGDGDETTGGGAATEAAPEETTAPEDMTTAPEEEGEAGAGIDVAAGDPKAGEDLFGDNCAVCHGTKGSGGATGPSLQDPELAEEEGDVVEQIVEGGGGMPAFGEQLSDQEIADVAAYVTGDLAQR